MVRSFPGVVERLADGLELLRIEGRTFDEFPGFHGLPIRSTLILPLGAQNTMATLVRPPVWLGEFRVICLSWHPRLPITNHCTKPCFYPWADISTLALGHGRNVGAYMRSLIQELRELADELREAEFKCGPGAAKIEQLKAAMKAKDDLLSRLAQPVRPKERFSGFVEF